MDRCALQNHRNPDHQEKAELDSKGEKVGDGVGDGHCQTREIDFAENRGVRRKSACAFGQAIGKISPGYQAAHVKKEWRNFVRGETCNGTENDREDRRGKDRLDQKPEWSEDGLFVLRGEVALYQKVNQIAVLPDFLPVDLDEAVLRLDDLGPALWSFNNGVLVHIGKNGKSIR